MQEGRVSDHVAMKPLPSPRTTVIHGEEAKGKPWLLTKSGWGLIKEGRRNETLVYQKGGYRRMSSRIKAGRRKIKGENEGQAGFLWFSRRNVVLV